jgi:cytochrome b
MSTKSVKVWDPVVRIGHWVLVIAFFTAYLTEDEFLTQHVWAGYVVASVVAFRILWGFVGSKHARFSDFIHRPSAIYNYFKGLIQRNPQHYVGHNPAGGMMVIALLLSLTGTVFTGIALYAVEENAGPLASIYGGAGNQTANQPVANSASIERAEEDEEREEGEENESSASAAGLAGVNLQDEDFWEGLHEFFANFTLLLIIFHVAGVIFSSIADKENLVKAMINGRKDIKD